MQHRKKNYLFTVIGFYQDNNQPFMDWVEATSPQEAATTAQKRRKGSAVGIVEVVCGKVTGCLLNEEVIYG